MNKQNLLYTEFAERFKKMSDEELIKAYKKDIGNPGWVSARAFFISALHEELDFRKLDYSKISNSKILSLLELQELSKKNQMFESESPDFKKSHIHKWENAYIPISTAIHNTRYYQVCFKCGKMISKN